MQLLNEMRMDPKQIAQILVLQIDRTAVELQCINQNDITGLKVVIAAFHHIRKAAFDDKKELKESMVMWRNIDVLRAT